MVQRERQVLGGALGSEVQQDQLARYGYAAVFVADLDVLDVACGSGCGARLLGDHGARSVLGIDPGSEAVARANWDHASENVSFQRGDPRALDLRDAGFDAVVSFDTIGRVPDVHAYLDEVHRVLTPGGLLVVGTPDRRLRGGVRRDLSSLLTVHHFAIEAVAGQRYLHPADRRLPVRAARAAMRRITPTAMQRGVLRGTGPEVLPAPTAAGATARYWVVLARATPRRQRAGGRAT